MKMLLFIALVPLLTCCSDLKKGGQIEKLEMMEGRLESSLELLEECKLKNATRLKDESSEIIYRIEMNEDDTISLERALKYDHFMKMYTVFESSENTTTALRNLILEELDVLKKLRLDINQGRGRRHEYDTYLKHEYDKVDWLESSVNEISIQMIEVKHNFATLVDELKEDVLNRTSL
ncbi:hypothetical protein OAU25_00220 [Crocinitomicaceae bacterium]|nr:hypothetical protein [Crocinitomicaceae bacterium]